MTCYTVLEQHVQGRRVLVLELAAPVRLSSKRSARAPEVCRPLVLLQAQGAQRVLRLSVLQRLLPVGARADIG